MSVRIYKECKMPIGFIMPGVREKECYNNAVHFQIANKSKFKDANMKIAYGFMRNKSVMGGQMWFRHCFILYNDEIIEVSPITNGEREYIIMETFNSVEELNMIKEYQYDTSLSKYLLKKEKEIVLPYINDNLKEYIKKSKYSQDYYLLEI